MELRKYQLEGVDYLRSVERGILADEMGVGKTPQLICAAQGKTLVVAPPPLHTNWHREIQRWRVLSDLTSVEVTSYHSLVDRNRKDGHGHVAGVVKPKWRRDWDTVIFDEAHHLKGRNTGYARAGVKIANETPNAWLATGTPIRNWAHEVFMLLRAIYPKDPRFSSFWRWADRWFTVENVDRRISRGKGKRPKVVSTRFVGDLRDITTWETFVEANGLDTKWLRRELDDPLVGIDLPPIQRISLPCDMGRPQRKVYRSMEKDFFANWDGQDLIATHSGSQWAHLMRIASGTGFHPEFEGTTMASAKLDALGELIDSTEGPFLVFAWYRHTVDQLVKWFHHREYEALPARGGMSAKKISTNMDAFRQGDTDVLVGTYSTLAEGHTFTNCNKTFLFETPPVPGHIDQAVARTRRFGQAHECTVWHLTTAETVDDWFASEVLPAKRSHSEGLISANDVRKYRDERRL